MKNYNWLLQGAVTFGGFLSTVFGSVMLHMDITKAQWLCIYLMWMVAGSFVSVLYGLRKPTERKAVKIYLQSSETSENDELVSEENWDFSMSKAA